MSPNADNPETSEDSAQPAPSRIKRTVQRILALAATALLVLFAYQAAEFFSFKSSQHESAREQASATTQEVTAQIDALLQRVEKDAQGLGAQFGAKEFASEDITALIRKTSLDFPEIRGVTVCYEPFAFNADQRLYCPYFNKTTGDFLFIEESYDYTERRAGTAWYGGVVDEGAKWTEPYFGASAGEWFVDYGVPFYWQDGPKKGQVRGIIDYSIGVEDFAQIFHTFSVGKAGYGFVASQSGLMVTHPIEDYVGKKTITEIADETESPALSAAIKRMITEASGLEEYQSALTDDAALFSFNTLPTLGGKIGIIYYQKDLIQGPEAYNRRYINMALTLSAFLVVLMALIFGRDWLSRGEIDILGALATILLLANVVLVGALQHRADEAGSVTVKKPVIDVSTLGNFVDQQNAVLKNRNAGFDYTVVPTGLFIERLEFQDSYNVNISGTLWQKYPTERLESLSTGVRLPQMSPFAEASYIEELSRETLPVKAGEVPTTLISYDMRVTLLLDLDYKNFPFDKRHLNIEIQPVSASDGLLFVPDLGSYADTGPARKPGLSERIELPGNAITRTFYNFSVDTYATDFGRLNSGRVNDVPVLHYNIYLKRYLFNAFVSYLIPIVVTLAMIYIMLLACTKTGDRQGIIESMAAFFFVLIFSHIDLRKDVVTADLIFIEYFYFITYGVIVLATLNLVSYTKSRTQVFDFNENQIFRVMYIPVFLTVLMGIMLVRFY